MAKGELLHLQDPKFNPDMLEYVKQDPVHDYEVRPIAARTREDRDIFFLAVNGIVVAVLCVAFTHGVPTHINHIFDIRQPPVSLHEATHAIFYSVFKTNVTTEIKNVGTTIINYTSEWIHANLPLVVTFMTLSPIPSLSKQFKEPPVEMQEIMEMLENRTDPVAKFHLGNGAKVFQVVPNADPSEKRQQQSWGWMVNYQYPTKDTNFIQ